MKQIADKKMWLNLAKWWQKMTPPMRPWPSEMKIYQQFAQKTLEGIKNPKILILGATPEMRDIAHSFKNSEVTCVDINLDMILGMRRLMKYKKETDKEIWVRGNWITAPLTQNYYHLILGDAVIGNLKLELLNQFLKRIKNFLKSNGAFISRVMITDRDKEFWQDKSLDEIFAYVKKNKLNMQEMKFLLFSKVRWISRQGYGDIDLRQQVLNKFWDKKKKQYKYPDPYIQKLLNQYNQLFPPSKYRWTTQTKAVYDKYFKKYFKIVDIKYGGGESPCNVSYHPIYFLKK